MLTTPLYAFQQAGVRRVEEFWGRALIGDEVGLGKTLQALYWAWRYLPPDPPGPVVAVVPAHLKRNWAREAATHLGQHVEILDHQVVPPDKPPPADPNQIYAINYDILFPPGWRPRCRLPADSWAGWLNALRPRLVILDECFPVGTPVLTDQGWLPIDEVVENRLPVRVAAFDFSGDRVVWESVTQYFKNHRRTRLVEVRHTNGVLTCTENHRVWTKNRGYVEAINLQRGDELCVVSEKIREVEIENDALLRTFMFGDMENVPTGKQRKTARQGRTGKSRDQITGPTEPGGKEADVEKQPVTQPCVCSEMPGYKGSERHVACLAGGTRRERENNPPRNHVTGSSVAGVGSPACHLHGGIREGISEQLQSGFRSSGPETSDRNRRSGASPEANAGKRPEKDGMPEACRVVGVAILERGSGSGCEGSGGGDPFVYCLEVANQHNFYANGVLVSNCQALQAHDSKRTRAIRKMLRGVPHVLALTGTPLKNNVIDLWPVLNMIRPDMFPSRFEFGLQFTQAVRQRWGWEFPGSRNLDVLHRLLADNVLIRRRKIDVAPDLPPITRQVIEMSIDLTEYRRAENDFLGWLTALDGPAALRAASVAALQKTGHLRRLAGVLKVPSVIAWVADFLDSGQKLLLGATHKRVTRPIVEAFGARAILVDGDLAAPEKSRRTDLFNDPNSPVDLLVGNTQSAGTGWNCTVTSDAALCEMPWTPAEIEQFWGRIYGLNRGLKGVPATVRTLIAADTIETDISYVLNRKQSYSDAAIDGGQAMGEFDTLLAVVSQMKRRRGAT